MIAFDETAVRRAVTAFRRARGVDDSPARVIARLDRAIEVSTLKGPDRRWRTIPHWSPHDDPGEPPVGYAFRVPTSDVGQEVLDRVLEIEGRRRGTGLRADAHTVLSVSRWARFSLALRDAHYSGLGWLLPVHGELLLVPMPTVLHDDTGRRAVEWMDGSKSRFPHGAEVDERTYRTVIEG